MTTSNKNLRTALITTAIITVALVWLIPLPWKWDLHWFLFLVSVPVFAGSLFRGLNRYDRDQARLDRPRDYGAHLNP